MAAHIDNKYSQSDAINKVWKDLINGKTKYEILRKIQSNAYKIPEYDTSALSKSQQYNIINKAYQLCKVELEQQREEMKATMYNRYLAVYEDAVDNSDRANAIKALDSISKLSGINEPDKLDITSDVNVTIDFNSNLDNEETE